MPNYTLEQILGFVMDEVKEIKVTSDGDIENRHAIRRACNKWGVDWVSVNGKLVLWRKTENA